MTDTQTPPPATAAAQPNRRSAGTITGAIGVITALIIGGLAIYDRVESQRELDEFRQQIEAAEAEYEAELREIEREQAAYEAEQADIADAWPDDIDIEFERSSFQRGVGGTTVPYSITNTSGRTASYSVEITIVDPDNRSEIHDSSTISTATLAPGETEHGELYFFSNGADWPLDAEGRWSYNVASATGFAF